jgi:hypothetical protein
MLDLKEFATFMMTCKRAAGEAEPKVEEFIATKQHHYVWKNVFNKTETSKDRLSWVEVKAKSVEVLNYFEALLDPI